MKYIVMRAKETWLKISHVHVMFHLLRPDSDAGGSPGLQGLGSCSPSQPTQLRFESHDWVKENHHNFRHEQYSVP
jgi:hypothetical protein